MIRRHMLSVAIIGAIGLVGTGIFLVERAGTVAPSGEDGTWNTGGGYIEPPQPVTQTPDQQKELPPLTNETPDVPLPKKPVQQTAVPNKPTQKDDFDFNSILAQLRAESTTQAKAGQSTATYEQLLQAFQNAPQQAIETVSAKRTPKQQALFAWGNTLGGDIQSFQALNSPESQTGILTDQIKNRADSSKATAVKDLAERYKNFGTEILAVSVPQDAVNLNTALGNAYIGVGAALTIVPDSADDKAFLAAITAYNQKADALTTALASVASYLSASEVRFGANDPGAVFGFHGR